MIVYFVKICYYFYVKTNTKKKIFIIIICAITLVVSILGLTIFFVDINKKDKIKLPIVISVHDITMKVGQVSQNFITISNPDAKVNFEYNENIISIEGNAIKALSVGSSVVKVQARSDESMASESFNVTVENNGLSYEVEIISGGTIDENTLYMQNDSCQFIISLFDENNKIINNQICSYSCSNSASQLFYEMNQFLLITDIDTVISIYFPRYNFMIELNVVIDNN